MIRRFQHRNGSRRWLRVFATALVLTFYIAAGTLHGLFDLDLAHASTTTNLETTKKQGGSVDPANVADHHCHGCFAVSLPQQAIVVARIVQMPVQHERRDIILHGLLTGLDPPPPKTLS